MTFMSNIDIFAVHIHMSEVRVLSFDKIFL
jgi:hypothetical protein